MTTQPLPLSKERPLVLGLLQDRSALRISSVVLFLVAWQVLGMMLNPMFLPTPLVVGRSLVDLVSSGAILEPTLSSFSLFAIGFVAAVVLGIPLGIFLGSSRAAAHFADLYVTVFWATPTIALLPLMVVWFGLSIYTKLIIVFLSAFWPTIINTQVGVQNVDETLHEVGAAFGGKRREILWKITLPASIPYIVAGLRIAVGRAVIGVIVAELYTSISGLGALMTYYSNFFQTANYFAALIILVAFSVVATEAIRPLESRFTHWKVQRHG